MSRHWPPILGASATGLAPPAWSGAMVALLWTAAAIVAGALLGTVVALGEPLPALIVGGIFAGSVLVAFPGALLWSALLYGLVGVGALNAIAGMDRADWLLSAMGVAFWALALTATLRDRSGAARLPVPAFVWGFVTFFALAAVVAIARFEDPLQLLIGARGYVAMFGVTLALALVPWSHRFIHRFALGTLLVGVAQLPVTLYQYVFVRAWRIDTGGRREGDSAIEASDSVFGTMGGDALSWGLDDLLALVLCALLAGVLAFAREGGITKARAALLASILAVPLFLSENKIVIVFLPLLVLILFGRDLARRPLRLLGAIAAAAAFVPAAAVVYYYAHWSTQYGSLETAVVKMTEYTFKPMYQRGLSDGDMSRLDAVQYWAEQQSIGDPAATLFGHGLAASKWSSTLFHSRLVGRHDNRRLDKSGLSALLWDTGLVGAIAFLAALAGACVQGGRLARSPALGAIDRAIVRGAQVSVLFALVLLPLKATLLTWAQASFVLFLSLGLIAFYHRQAAAGRAGSSSP